MVRILTAAHPRAGIHLGVVVVFALALSCDVVDCSMGSVLAATVSYLAGRQNDRLGIIANANTGSSIDCSPLIFALAYA
jgi:hypothetical protein